MEEKYIDHLKDIDPEVLIEHEGGTVMYGQKVYAFEAYEGTFGGVARYYTTLACVHNWPDKVLEMVLLRVYSSCNPYHLSDLHKIPFVVSPLDPMIKRPRNKWLLIYAVGMISLIILLNIALFFSRHHVSWNMSTYSLLTILNLMAIGASSIALWSYNANK